MDFGRETQNGSSSLDESEQDQVVPHFIAKRHVTCGNPTPAPNWITKHTSWRAPTPGKLKTSNAALVMCLNIDIDPPDSLKTNPCSVLECWVNPQTLPAAQATTMIAANIHHQFESLSVKLNYKAIMDPFFDELQKACLFLRKQAKDDAVVFYYNGHGVPKPTASGELWCFNKTYTQYIPVSLQEIQNWIGSPGVYIWDCSAAGHLLENFKLFAERRDHDIRPYGHQHPPFMSSLQLAACTATETLPSCPELPADLFTACLTSPIDMALRFFALKNQLPHDIEADLIVQLPGDLKDRRTPLGELNWIFTAITDTIAWTTFSKEVFARLYRCDLLIASLFRNFLLAERIMKDYNCTPYTHPPLPATNTHPLWATWDLAVDSCLRQLPHLLRKDFFTPLTNPFQNMPFAARGRTPPANAQADRLPGSSKDNARIRALLGDGSLQGPLRAYSYVPNRFFADQLTAFEVWISRGGAALTKRGPMSLPSTSSIGDSTSAEHLVPRKPPEQLPIVLQVLLSQPHRLRALILLSQFVDLGAWAVNLVLSIGIFPYISKLLQAPGPDLRPVLIFIWARILAVDPSVQMDLYSNSGYKYFATVLGLDEDGVLPNVSEHKAMCAFILSAVARDFPHGQQACLEALVFDNCFERLDEGDFLLRQWSTLCIAQIWDGNDAVKVYGVDRGVQDKLISLFSDDCTEVRAAALYALGTFLGASGSLDPKIRGGGCSGSMPQLEERVHFRMEVAVATGAALAIKDDASPMCRKELIVLLSCLVKEWRGYFVIVAWIYWEEDSRWRHPEIMRRDDDVTGVAISEWLDRIQAPLGISDDKYREESRVLLSSFFTMFITLLDLASDSYPEVATMASTALDYIMALLLESPFMKLENTALTSLPYAPAEHLKPYNGLQPMEETKNRPGSIVPSASMILTSSSQRPPLTRSDTATSQTLKRTSSFANALMHLANGVGFPHAEEESKEREAVAPSLLAAKRTISIEGPDAAQPPPPALTTAQYISPYPNSSMGVPSPSSPLSQTTYTNTPLFDPFNGPPSYQYDDRSTKSHSEDFQPCDVMEALIFDDLLRLKSRRNRRKHEYQEQHQHPEGIPSPSSSTFSDSNRPRLRTGEGIQDVLPFKSTFFDWCAEYFKEPQMRQAEHDEPGSTHYNREVWRQQRNEQVINDTASQVEVAHRRRWDRPVATLQVPHNPLSMVFHSFDSHLVVANEADTVTVMDWSKKKKLQQFHNGNPFGTTITSLHIINEEIGGIILTGASDGVVRLFRNYDSEVDTNPIQLVTAFRTMHETVSMPDGSGMVLDWTQSKGTLFVGGDSRIITTWDANTETQALEMETNADSPVTCIKSDSGASQIFLASFGDGDVRVFDRRMEEDDAVVQIYKDAHDSWVQSVRWHPLLKDQFLSAGLDGSIKLFDLRRPSHSQPVNRWDPYPSSGLASFDVHPLSPTFICTSPITPIHYRSHRVSFFPISENLMLSEEPISSLHLNTGLTVAPGIVEYGGFGGGSGGSMASSVSSSYSNGSSSGGGISMKYTSPVIPRMTSAVFHPMQMLVGIGEPDGSVRVMGCKL